jgi:hypothetical protein
MSYFIKRYALTSVLKPQAVKMPKRARIIFTANGSHGPVLCALVEEDADTQAFDLGKHERFFQVCSDGMPTPEGGVHVGSVQTGDNHRQGNAYHVFEVRGRT